MSHFDLHNFTSNLRHKENTIHKNQPGKQSFQRTSTAQPFNVRNSNINQFSTMVGKQTNQVNAPNLFKEQNTFMKKNDFQMKANKRDIKRKGRVTLQENTKNKGIDKTYDYGRAFVNDYKMPFSDQLIESSNISKRIQNLVMSEDFYTDNQQIESLSESLDLSDSISADSFDLDDMLSDEESEFKLDTLPLSIDLSFLE